MMKFIFNEEEDLGKVVSSVKPFCTLSPNRPIEDAKLLTLQICGAKFSKLCGFTFRSIDEHNTKFMIVYCPKTKHNFSKQHVGMSGWYCWLWRNVADVVIMPKKEMMDRFGFNVDKFFCSDLFQKYSPIFVKQTAVAIKELVYPFIDKMSPGDPDYPVARFKIACVKESLKHINDVVRDIMSGTGEEAKLAYNANSQYSLNMKQNKPKDYSNFGKRTSQSKERGLF